jgi:hypothetical protein
LKSNKDHDRQSGYVFGRTCVFTLQQGNMGASSGFSAETMIKARKDNLSI